MRPSVVLLNGVDATRDATIPRPWLPLSPSYLQANGVQAVLIDPQIHADWEARLRAAVVGASYFGVTSMTGPSVGVALDAIAVAREVAPAVPVVWGGYHATLTHRAIVREGVADVAVVGPGERAAVALADAFAGGTRALAEVNGITYRGSDGRVAVTARPPPQNMNELPTWD